MANRCWARRHSCWRRGSPCLRATWILVQGRESMDLARIWSRLDRGTLLLSRLHRHEFVRIISTVSTSSNRYSNRLAPWRRLGTAFERWWGFLLDSRISSEMVGRLASSDNGRSEFEECYLRSRTRNCTIVCTTVVEDKIGGRIGNGWKRWPMTGNRNGNSW